MNERHTAMLEILAGLKAKAAERDKLMERLEYSIDSEIQHDLDHESNLKTSAKDSLFKTAYNLDGYNRFVLAYEDAVAKGEDTFLFDDRDFWTGYARRVIDQLYESFKRLPNVERRCK